MGIGDWDWGLGIGPNPQSPIPNPQLDYLIEFFIKKIKAILKQTNKQTNK